MSRRAPSLALTVVAAVACCDGPPPPSPTPTSTPPLTATLIADGLDDATGLAVLPDGRLLISERGGRLLAIRPEQQPAGRRDTLATLDPPVAGVTLGPEFLRTRTVWTWSVHALDQGGAELRIARARLDGDTLGEADARFAHRLTYAPSADPNLVIGRDRRLYIATAVRAPRTGLAAQRRAGRAGSILRLNDDGSLPSDNPLGPWSPVFARGFHEPRSIAIDPVHGTIWVADADPTRIVQARAGGNAGWPVVHGVSDRAVERLAARMIGDVYLEPVWSASDSAPPPVDIAILESATYGPRLDNRIVLASAAPGALVEVPLRARDRRTSGIGPLVDGFEETPVHIATGPDGRLYVLTTRRVYRLDLLP